jgi:hypothetical protein
MINFSLLRKDVTRYRYGQEAHLDESLERLGLSPTDEERPILTSLLKQDWEGKYVLTLRTLLLLVWKPGKKSRKKLLNSSAQTWKLPLLSRKKRW